MTRPSVLAAAILGLTTTSCSRPEQAASVAEQGANEAELDAYISEQPAYTPKREAYVLDADTQITIRTGFDAELLYSVPEAQGSWVAMDFDQEGRLLVSDQDDKGVFRVTLADDGDPDSRIQVESLQGFPHEVVKWGKRRVSGALGFLHAFDSLYMSSMKGFYRIRDTNGDDIYDEFKLLKRLAPGWEHSAHTIIKTEDGKGLYLISGNHSRLPDGVRTVQPKVWGRDSLLPSMVDPSGHARGVKAPGGWICRISPDGQDWNMIASGLRNAVDMAINREGELFTYDSDLEFDVGSPWYRPTRVHHVTSGAEFGWRTGSAKWPDYFADSNGAVIDMGPGSPTGISFGHHSNFPPEFQDKLFVCDWTFGTIFTIDLEEDGSSYTGNKQEFLNGQPLNISAMRFGPDGHMYFVIGGRNTDSKLYRIRYTGASRTGPSKQLTKNQALRDLRHSLESLHDRKDAVEVAATAWPHLGHEDRSIRYAARIAIERQPLASWQDQAFAEQNPRARIYALIALCRHGDESVQDRVLKALDEVSFADLDRQDQLALLRAYSLGLIRLGEANSDERASIAAKFNPFYPANDEALNTELCRLLSYLDAPAVVAKTVALMKATTTKTLAYDKEMLARHKYGKPILEAMANTPNSQNIHYAYCLRRVTTGWTRDLRKHYFGWLKELLERSGGQSFEGYIRAIREDAIEHLPERDKAAVAWLIGDVQTVDLGALPSPLGPPVSWTTDKAVELFSGELRGRNFDNGKLMFSAGRCAACHRFQGSGGRAGPDLGSLGKRFSVPDIVRAICEPSDTISEQFQASVVTRKDGSSISGRVIYQDDTEIAVAANPYDFAQLIKTPMANVDTVTLSEVSMMPRGMIDLMNADEVKDLIAYLVSGGNSKHAVFTVK